MSCSQFDLLPSHLTLSHLQTLQTDLEPLPDTLFDLPRPPQIVPPTDHLQPTQLAFPSATDLVVKMLHRISHVTVSIILFSTNVRLVRTPSCLPLR